MATQYFGKNATLRDNSHPAQMITVGDVNGRVRMAYDEFDIAVQGGGVAIATNDYAEMQEIPLGARIVGGWFYNDAITSGVVDIGWEASSDALEAAVGAGLISALSVSSAAFTLLSGQAAALLGVIAGKTFAGKCRVKVKFTTGSAVVTGKIKLCLLYVID